MVIICCLILRIGGVILILLIICMIFCYLFYSKSNEDVPASSFFLWIGKL